MPFPPYLLTLYRHVSSDEGRLAILFSVALVFHSVIDPILTVYSTGTQSMGYETNLFLLLALDRGLPAFIVIHIPFIVISLGCYYGLIYFIRKADPPKNKRLATAIEIGFAGLLVWGFALTVWNLTVLFGFY